MQQTIAETYEIIRQIGSGGAGVVFLARHRRLDKLVVLKADKRELSTRTETLRREVDALKNLSHGYLPQVYDFLVENGTVYTVIDFIPGESMDKPLARGQRFPQPLIVKWACQLLEALVYLHGRPPHGILHADIKPANIMLKPDGDICLIDFNIALALGEHGAVRVGRSPGYASPEHYSPTEHIPRVGGTETITDASDLIRDDTATDAVETTDQRASTSGNSSSYSTYGGSKKALLDVRSDIYSTGATLYHLLSGVRPARRAQDVTPMPKGSVSSSLERIVTKAMSPNPDDRYQTAQEMLIDLRRLHDDDSRSRRLLRRTRIVLTACTAIFLLGGALVVYAAQQTARTATAENVVLSGENVILTTENRKANAVALAADSAQAAQDADLPAAVSLACASLENWETAAGEAALARASGVYNLNGGFHPAQRISLGAKPVKLRASPEGGVLATLAGGRFRLWDISAQRELDSLEAYPSALAEAVFTEDHRLYYAAPDGLRCCDPYSGVVFWTGDVATGIACSEDGTTVAAVLRDEPQALIYDAQTGAKREILDFGNRGQMVLADDVYADPDVNLFALSRDGRYLAVSFSDGSVTVFDISVPGDRTQDLRLYEEEGYQRFEGGFCGDILICCAASPQRNVFRSDVLDMVKGTAVFQNSDAGRGAYHCWAGDAGLFFSNQESIWVLDVDGGNWYPVVQTDSRILSFSIGDAGLLALTESREALVFTPDGAPLAVGRRGENAAGLAVQAGQWLALAGLDDDAVRLLRREERPESAAFRYPYWEERHESRVSRDGTVLTLFNMHEFRSYDVEGEPLAQQIFEDSDTLLDVYYSREGEQDTVHAFWSDGTHRSYNAISGVKLEELYEAPPDTARVKVRETADYRVEVPRNGVAELYARVDGTHIATLALNGTVTYATQIGDRLVLEYFVQSDVHDFGALLLDPTDEPAEGPEDGLKRLSDVLVGEMPGLCDVFSDGTLYFDDGAGCIRKGRIYSYAELLEQTA